MNSMARKLEVDNGIPLHHYYRIADNLLKQASRLLPSFSCLLIHDPILLGKRSPSRCLCHKIWLLRPIIGVTLSSELDGHGFLVLYAVIDNEIDLAFVVMGILFL